VKIDRLLQTLWRRTPIFGQFPKKTVKFTTDPSMTPHYSLVAWGVLKRGHAKASPAPAGSLCAGHAQQLGGESPPVNLMEVKAY
jgi:hypothetical protein